MQYEPPPLQKKHCESRTCPVGTVVFGVTVAPGATMAPLETFAPSIIVAPAPIMQSSSSVQAWMVARGPAVLFLQTRIHNMYARQCLIRR